MKANELMTGDWVKLKKDHCKFLQLTAIDETYNSINYFDGDAEGELTLQLKAIEPIPITPEILEKNGFRETDVVVVGTRKMRWESEDTRTEITIWMDDTMPMEIRKNIYYEDEVCYTLPFAWAVHELQHALRLCGIDKSIVT
jgi:hypothetical protein